MIVLVAVWVLAAVLALLLVAAVVVVASDQAIARASERFTSTFLTGPLGGAVSVHVEHQPFLRQALRGRYDDVRVVGADLRLGEIRHAAMDGRLYNAYVPFRALVRKRIVEVPCERVVGTVVVGYRELARLTRVPTLAIAHDGQRMIASVSIPIPGISSLARVSGEAMLSVAADGIVRLRMRGVAVAGFAVPSIVLSQLLPSLSFVVPVSRLPYGLRITGLDPVAEGVVVHLAADAVVFKRPSPRPTSPVS